VNFNWAEARREGIVNNMKMIFFTM
jgi:hypothetical protein